MTDDIKRIDIAEFRALGYLQELNRRFLHPLGLAMEVVVEDDGTERLGGVWDYRDDPEGIRFGGSDLTERAGYVTQEMIRRAPARRTALGYVVQPPDPTGDSDGMMDALYKAWVVIANARDWLLDDAQAAEWRAAAERWRDNQFHPLLDAHV
jgi:hypothetical protein